MFDTENYINLLEDLRKVKVGGPNEFLAGHAIMGRILQATFETLPMSPKGRAVMVPDGVYWCPTKIWLENTLLPYCQKVLSDRKVKYGHQYDCDDFSRDFLSISHERFMKERITLPIDSICVGEAWYTTSYSLFLKSLGFPYDNHAINFVVIHEDSEVLFIEPQTCKVIQLTPEEVQSIYFVRF